MVFKTIGNKSNPVILFFHAMGVIGESSMPVAEKMKEKYYCIMPTSTVYCPGQRYHSKRDEIQQIVRFLENHGIKKIELVGSKEEHFKYRNAVMQTYIHGNFPVFEGFNHMQYQIQNPEGFARMLKKIIETDRLPELVF